MSFGANGAGFCFVHHIIRQGRYLAGQVWDRAQSAKRNDSCHNQSLLLLCMILVHWRTVGLHYTMIPPGKQPWIVHRTGLGAGFAFLHLHSRQRRICFSSSKIIRYNRAERMARITTDNITQSSLKIWLP